MLEGLRAFVENGGRIRAGEEPRFGEPYYREYMKQYFNLHYRVGDIISVQYMGHDGNVKPYEGPILSLQWNLQLLVSGRTVHKDRRNLKELSWDRIQDVTFIRKRDESFDISIVYPNAPTDSVIKKETLKRSKAMQEKERECNRKEFLSVYPDKNYDTSHFIQVHNGCQLYWPFYKKSVKADIYIVNGDGEDPIKKIPCKTGSLLPNKNWCQAYNYKNENGYPELDIALPDDGTLYENLSIVCVWSIVTAVDEEEIVIKVVDMHCFRKITPIKAAHNLIVINMSISPLLEYGISFDNFDAKDTEASFALTKMMGHDMYYVVDVYTADAVAIKTPEAMTEDEEAETLSLSILAVFGFDMPNLRQTLSFVKNTVPNVEFFCNIDEDPKRYYSKLWHAESWHGYKFSILREE